MESKTEFKLILVSAIIGSLLAVAWSTTWDEQIEEISIAAGVYEDCVLSEYSTTPYLWYEEHGKWPECY